MKHLMDPMDLTITEIESLLHLATDMIDHKEKYHEVCKNKTLATCFFEPSTRTRLSFEAAMLELGGNVLGFSSANSSSASKGESVADTARTVACYADIIAMRHPKEGAPFVASRGLNVPLINAGDGGHNHPTQTLTDLFTMHQEKGHLDHLVIGLCGDLKFGRTVHSLIKAMTRYSNIHFILISPEELKVPEYIIEDVLKKSSSTYEEVATIEEVIERLDVLYMTRVQRERFASEDEYNRLKDTYVLDLEKLEKAKTDLTILHPLPRVQEIAVEVDSDPRAAYFRQVYYGKIIRKALIMTMLGLNNEGNDQTSTTQRKTDFTTCVTNVYRCTNPHCITSVEQQLDHVFACVDEENETYRCIYCEAKIV